MFSPASAHKLGEVVVFAFRSLMRHKLRSFLTMLGIIFGIAAVIAMLALGAGAREKILSDIQKLGITNIIIKSEKPPEDSNASTERSSVNRYGLTFRDAEQISETVNGIQDILPIHAISTNVWFGNKRIESRIRGIDPARFHMLNMEIDRGRALTPLDGDNWNRVCLITPDLLGKLAYIGDPIGLELTIKEDVFKVVGIIRSPEFSTFSTEAMGMAQIIPDIYVPYATSLARFGTLNIQRKAGSWESSEVELQQIIVRVSDQDIVLPAAKMINTVLKKFHEDKQDYKIVVPLEILRQSKETQRQMDFLLIIIASISLLVGGIGIVNIMLATITERTKEIGIRRALGATRRDITFQFLVETIVLSAFGGLFGCALGVGGVKVVDAMYTQWTSLITWQSVVVSIGISCAVGIIFGIFPARRAASMNPITALRHE